MNKKVSSIVLMMSLLMLFSAVPVFAAPPTKGPYTQIIVDHSLGSTEFWTGDVLHIRDAFGECYLSGAPFPLGNSISSSYVARGDLHTVIGVGGYMGHTVDTYAAGMVEGIINIKFTGFDAFVYTGPPFTCILSGVDYTVTTGDVFVGLLYDVMAVKHGTGDLAGFTLKGTSTGVSIVSVIVGDPDMVGINLSVETGRYSGL